MTEKLDSPAGKQMLAHVMQQEYCVMEFKKREDGGYTIADITEHHEQLEEMVDDPRDDNPTNA